MRKAYCFHGLEAGVTARFSFGGLEQAVEGFDEAAGLAGPRPSDDAVKMVSNHGGDVLHGLDFGAHDIGAPLREHGGMIASVEDEDEGDW